MLRPVTSLLELTEAFDLIAARMTRPRSWAGGELLAERTDECAPHDGMHAEEGEVRAGHDRAVRQREDKRVGRFDPDRDAQQRGGAEAGDQARRGATTLPSRPPAPYSETRTP